MSRDNIPTYPLTVTLAGSGRRGFVDGHRTAEAYFDAPLDMLELPDGSLLVADGRNNCMRRIDLVTAAVTTLPALAFLGPRAPVLIDDGAALCVCDSGHNKIRMIQFNGPAGDPYSSLVDVTIAGTGRAGCADGSADTADFHRPSGMCVISDGSILVADTQNHSIRRIAGRPGKSGLFVTTVMGGAGKAGFVDGDAATARLHTPTSIVADKYGTVLVADAGNHAVRALHPPANGDFGSADWALTTLAGAGEAGFEDAVDAGAVHARFRDPTRVAIGAHGELLLVDTGNNCIRALLPSQSGNLGPHTGVFTFSADTQELHSVDALEQQLQPAQDVSSRMAARGLLGVTTAPPAAITPSSAHVVLLRAGDVSRGGGASAALAHAASDTHRAATPRRQGGRSQTPSRSAQGRSNVATLAHRAIVVAKRILSDGGAAPAGLPWWAAPLVAAQARAMDDAADASEAPTMSPLLLALQQLQRSSSPALSSSTASASVSTPARMLAAASDMHVVPYSDPQRIAATHRRYNRVITIAGPSPSMVHLAAAAMSDNRRSNSRVGAYTRGGSSGGSSNSAAALVKAAGISSLAAMSRAASAAAQQVAAVQSFEWYADGASTLQARFRRPHGICALSSRAGGSVVVADTGNNYIRLLLSAQAIDSHPPLLRAVLSPELLIRAREAADAARLVQQSSTPAVGRSHLASGLYTGPPNPAFMAPAPAGPVVADAPAVTADLAASTALSSPRMPRGAGMGFASSESVVSNRPLAPVAPFRDTIAFDTAPTLFRSPRAQAAAGWRSASTPRSPARTMAPSTSLMAATQSVRLKQANAPRARSSTVRPSSRASSSLSSPVSLSGMQTYTLKLSNGAHAQKMVSEAMDAVDAEASSPSTSQDAYAAAGTTRARRASAQLRRLSTDPDATSDAAAAAAAAHAADVRSGARSAEGPLSPTSMHLLTGMINTRALAAARADTSDVQAASLEELAATDLATLEPSTLHSTWQPSHQLAASAVEPRARNRAPPRATPSPTRDHRITAAAATHARRAASARKAARPQTAASGPRPRTQPAAPAQVISLASTLAETAISLMPEDAVTHLGARASETFATSLKILNASIADASRVLDQSALSASQLGRDSPQRFRPRSASTVTRSTSRARSQMSSSTAVLHPERRFVEGLCDGRERVVVNGWMHSRDALAVEDSRTDAAVLKAALMHADPHQPLHARFTHHTASSAAHWRAAGRLTVKDAPAFVNVSTTVARMTQQHAHAVDDALSLDDAQLLADVHAAIPIDDATAAHLRNALRSMDAPAASVAAPPASSSPPQKPSSDNAHTHALLHQAKRRASLGGHTIEATAASAQPTPPRATAADAANMRAMLRASRFMAHDELLASSPAEQPVDFDGMMSPEDAVRSYHPQYS